MADWVCTNCGATYDSHDPPCLKCAGENIVNIDDFEKSQQIGSPDRTAWECKECGERHVKNNPPCKKCGHMGFQQVANPEQRGAESGTAEDPSLIGRRSVFLYGGGIVAAIAGGGYLYLSRNNYPTNTAPGKAQEASGIRFETVETELRGIINDERESEGANTLSVAANVDAFATYYNKEYVKAGGNNLRAVDSGEFDGKFNVSDYDAVGNYYGGDFSGRAIDYFESASELARNCANSWLSDSRFRNPLTDSQYSQIGLDVHVDPAGDIFFIVVVE